MTEEIVETPEQEAQRHYEDKFSWSLEEWLEREVKKFKNKSIKWLSQYYFHREESRPTPIDSQYMYTPADGVILDAIKGIKSNENLVDVKGIKYSVGDLLGDEDLEEEDEYLVVSVFMTFYSQHINYMPYAGVRNYDILPPLKTHNLPMLAVEKDILKGVVNPEFREGYIKENAREVSEIYSPTLKGSYTVIRIADYDVNSFVNIYPDENIPYTQNQKIGSITYGSESILIINLSDYKESGIDFELTKHSQVGRYVKCKKTPLVKIKF